MGSDARSVSRYRAVQLNNYSCMYKQVLQLLKIKTEILNLNLIQSPQLSFTYNIYIAQFNEYNPVLASRKGY